MLKLKLWDVDGLFSLFPQIGKIPGPKKPLFGHVFSVCLSVLAFLTSIVIVWRFLVSVRSRKVLALRKPDGDKQGLEIRDLRSQNILGLVAKSFRFVLGVGFFPVKEQM